jgi:hypothetical protein
VSALLMETATACLAHRIKPMLPRREATTIACHCCRFPLAPSANNHTVTANVLPVDPQMTKGVARALALLLTSLGTVPSKAAQNPAHCV